MSENKLPHDASQWTISFQPEQLQVDQFIEENLELPAKLAYAVKKRQIEFLCGRLCVKRCLETLGYPSAPLVGTAEDRSPVWPAGLIGSISHTDRIATAVVGPSNRIEAVGIDIERLIADATPQLVKHICCDQDELGEVISARNLSREEALTLIFSGKESFYKAVYPSLRRFFGFQSARIKVVDQNRLQVLLCTDLSDSVRKGVCWELKARRLTADLMETLVLKPKA